MAIQTQQIVLIGSCSLLRLLAGCTVVAFYGFIQGINLPASTFQSRHPHHDFLGKPCSQTNTTDRIVTGGPVCRKRPSKSGSLLSSNQSFRCKLAPPTPGVACDWQVLGGDTTALSHDQVLPSILQHHGSSAAWAEMLVTLDRAGRSTLPITRRRAFDQLTWQVMGGDPAA